LEPDILQLQSTFSRAEQRLWEAFRAGQQVDLRLNGKAGRDDRSPVRKAVVRAEVIDAILYADPGSGARARLMLSGARITGSLDLTDARVEHAIILRDCVFDQPIILAGARLGALTLSGSEFPGIDAPNLEIDGDLDLSRIRSSRTVNLTGAHFHHDIRMSGARLGRGDDQEVALSADHLAVDGSVTCDGEFEAAGTVTMAGARVNGAVRLDGAKITASHRGQVAFYGDGMTVGHDVSAAGLSTDGGVRLVDASIASTLELRGAKLANADGVALRLDRAEILSSLYCDNGFTAVGDITAIGIHVKGSVYLNRAQIGQPAPGSDTGGWQPTGTTLSLYRAKIDGDLGCWDGFVVHGTIDLSRLSVAGEFNLVTSDLRGYPTAADLAGSQFSRVAIMGDPPSGLLDFTDVKTDFYRDGPAHRERGAIVLDGFEYNSIQMTHVTLEERKQWLMRAMEASKRKFGSGNDGYLPQPYNQLAKVYRRVGNEREAKLIAIERENQRDRVMPWRYPAAKISSRIYKITLSYGYNLKRAALLLPVLYLISVLMVHVAQQDNAFVAVDETARSSTTVENCTSAYPCLSDWAYPVDWVVPIINLHQSEFWQPDAHSAIGKATRDWLYTTTILGWAVTTLLIGAFTGLIRRD
jgi:hypothetical protein